MPKLTHFKSLLSFEDVAAELGCDDDTVRMLVVEERSLPAIYVTQIGCQEPFDDIFLGTIGAIGMVFSLYVDNYGDHTGYLRIKRTALDEFIRARGSLFSKQQAEARTAAKEFTYLNIIAALLELVLTPRNGRTSQAAVISELVTNFEDKPGISKPTLEKVFASARRSFKG